MISLYLADFGILLNKEDKEYEAYASYDKQYGFYDENQYYAKNLEKVIEEADTYVKNGICGTYAIITKQGPFKDDISDKEIEDMDLSDSDYSADAVVYSIKKDTDGSIKKNFIIKP